MNGRDQRRAFAEQVGEAAAHVRSLWSGEPRAAMILGTGLGDLADGIAAEAAIPYADIPHFPHSTAPSHRSRLVCGRLAGVPLIVMQGRCHLYEGHAADRLALPVHVMHALGAGLLIVSNAGGGLNPQLATGGIVVLQDHVNLMWTAPLAGRPDHAAAAAASRRGEREIYDQALIDHALAVARREQFAAHRGVYVSVSGPTYETRAEYRMFRAIGGDVVGMSTVPETIAARRCGMRVLALSLVTNVAKPDAPEVVDAGEVVEAAARAAPNMQKIAESLLGSAAGCVGGGTADGPFGAGKTPL